MRTGKMVKIWMILILLPVVMAPTAVWAAADGKDHDGVSKVVTQHEGEDEEGSSDEGHNEEEGAQEGSGSDGVGFVLGFLGGLIFLIIAVVAVLGAVGLGIIGIGYASVSSSEE